MRIVEPFVKLIHATPLPEVTIERAGRLCWKSEGRMGDGTHENFIAMLKGKNHESVLEHASAGFIIGCDRGISHELVRHRIASFSQTSTRYVCYAQERHGSEISVVKPVDLQEGTKAFNSWLWAMEDAERAYLEMIQHGASPQVARSVLPTCTFTEIAMTANLREWRHFLSLRLSTAAHPDMQVIARMIRDELVSLAPTVFSEWSKA